MLNFHFFSQYTPYVLISHTILNILMISSVFIPLPSIVKNIFATFTISSTNTFQFLLQERGSGVAFVNNLYITLPYVIRFFEST